MEELVRAIEAFVLAGLLVLPVRSASARQASLDEYREKAHLLGVFPNFVGWPAGAFPSAITRLLIWISGDFYFSITLAELTRGAIIRGRQVEIR
jgi:hypothetical protein